MFEISRFTGMWVLLTATFYTVAANAELDGEVNGTYRFVGGVTETQRITERIETTVGFINTLLRPLARRLLGRNTRVPEEVTIDTNGEMMSVGTSFWPARETRLDGTPTTFVNIRGQETVMTRTLRGARIVERATANGATRRIIYCFLGRRLRMDWAITSRVMPRPLQFSLTYVR